MPILPPAFHEKVICFGEIHGVSQIGLVQIQLIQNELENNRNVFVLLERDYDQQGDIDFWLERSSARESFSKRFQSAKTFSFGQAAHVFLNELAKLGHKYPGKISVRCVDISFDPTVVDGKSEIIRVCGDEDDFDDLREKFIIDQISSNYPLIQTSDRTFWLCGNMHASKTQNYFPLADEPSSHILTSTSWLHQNFGCESIFSLPFEGVKTTSSLFKDIKPFYGFKKSELCIPSTSFISSYDWVLGTSKDS